MKFLIVIFASFSVGSFAAQKDTNDLTVSQISIWASTGHLLVQTSPKHSIDGLNCTSNYWLTLNKGTEGYETSLSLLLAAQMSGKKVSVRAVDDAGTEFCRLERVITYQ